MEQIIFRNATLSKLIILNLLAFSSFSLAVNQPSKNLKAKIIPGRIIIGVPRIDGTPISQKNTIPRKAERVDQSNDLSINKHLRPILRKRFQEGGLSRIKFRKLKSLQRRSLRGAVPQSRSSTSPDYYQLRIEEFENEKSGIRKTLRYIKALRKEKGITAYPDYEAQAQFFPNDTYIPPTSRAWGQTFSNLWGLEKLAIFNAWDISQGVGSLVAVIDTGVDYFHPDLIGRTVSGWDFVNEDSDPMDDRGHGTHVAGTIAATADNGIGIAGVAPQALILPLKALGESGSGSFSDVMEAVDFAVAQGASVINMSLGAYLPLVDVPPPYFDSLEQAHNSGVTVVVSAGNSYGNDAENYFPANDPNVITVAASDHLDLKASFSNKGVKISVTAPGGGDADPSNIFYPSASILSLKASNASPAFTGEGQLIVGSNYARKSGTSMAAPHVAGVVALVRSLHPDWNPEQVRQALEVGSDDVSTPGFDLNSGYGRINALRALQQSTPLAVQISERISTVKGVLTPIPIQGTVSGPNLVRWELEYGVGTLPTAWSTIASGSSEIRNSTLGVWDVTRVPEGVLSLRLWARNTSNAIYEYRKQVTIDQIFISEPAPWSTQNITPFRTGSTITIKGSVINGNLSRYFFEVRNSNDWTLIPANISIPNGGSQTVSNGVLGTWDTTGLLPSHYDVFLVADLTDGSRQTHDRISVIVDPTLRRGWPVSLGRELLFGFNLSLMEHITVADLDGDGTSEILAAYGEYVHAFNHRGIELPGWPKTIDPQGIGMHIQYAVAAADLNGDQRPEIIAGNGSAVYVWDYTGNLLSGWPRASHGIFVTAEDLDGNGTNEIVVSGHNYLDVFDRNGVPVPGRGKISGYDYWSRTAIGDINNDGQKEIVVIEQDWLGRSSRLHAFGNQGQELAGWPITVRTIRGTTPVLGDLDGDGYLETVVAEENGIQIFRYNGVPFPGWPQTTLQRLNNITLADVYGDERPEVIVGSFSTRENNQLVNYLYVFESNGSLVPNWPLRYTPSNYQYFGFGAIAVGDVNNDKLPDIIVSADGGYPFRALHAFNIDGTEVSGFPKLTSNLGSSETGTSALSDLDGNGTLELIWTDIDHNINVWDLSVSTPTNMSWPMFGQNPKLTFAAVNIPDHKPPILGQIAVSKITKQSAEISWNTDELSDTRVTYGLSSTTLNQTYFNATLVAPNHVATLGGLSAGTTYYFRVSSKDQAGNELSSNVLSFTTIAEPLSVPASFVTTILSPSQLQLSWLDNNSGEIGFRIDRALSAVGPWLELVNLPANSTSHRDTALSADTTYYYRIQALALNPSENSSFSSIASGLTLPAAPTSLVATPVSTTSINLTWSEENPAEAGHRIERSLSINGTWVNIANLPPNTTNYQDGGLTPYTRYYYRVVAYSTSGDSPLSNTANAVTFPPDHILFVTSTKNAGNLGSLSGADQICQNRAIAANVRPDRPWKAILSTESVHAKDRVRQDGPIYNPNPGNPTRKIDDPGLLFAGDIKKAVIYDENLVDRSGDANVWTGTRGDGTLYAAKTCSGFTSLSGNGAAGGTRHTSGQWLNDEMRSCSGSHRIYCLSQ